MEFPREQQKEMYETYTPKVKRTMHDFNFGHFLIETNFPFCLKIEMF